MGPFATAATRDIVLNERLGTHCESGHQYVDGVSTHRAQRAADRDAKLMGMLSWKPDDVDARAHAIWEAGLYEPPRRTPQPHGPAAAAAPCRAHRGAFEGGG